MYAPLIGQGGHDWRVEYSIFLSTLEGRVLMGEQKVAEDTELDQRVHVLVRE